jgi:hypothetical protein
VKIFRRYEGTEVKPLQKVPNSELLDDFRGGNKIGVIGVAMLNQSDYFWLSNIIVL